MAFLIPDNLASKPEVPAAVQNVARAFKQLTGDDVTVVHDVATPDVLDVIDPRVGVLRLAVLAGGSRGMTRKTMLGGTKPSVELEDLEQRANADVRDLLARLRQSPHLSRQVPVVGAIATTDGDRATARAAGLDPDQLLLREDFTPTGLPAAIARLFGGTSPRLVEREERAVRATLNPEIVIRDTIVEQGGQHQIAFRAPLAEGQDTLAVLDREQHNLAANLGAGYRVIRGVAGSGKSLVLTFRAKFLAERFPQWTILLLCYNKVLSKALAHQLAGHTNVEVMTLDALAFRVARRSCKTPDDWEQQRRDATMKLRAEGGRYDVVLVDEGQDLDGDMFDLAYAALRTHREEPQFVVVLDAAQNIYRKSGRWNPPGMTARGRTSLMRVNYRNTKEILELAYRMLAAGAEATSEEAILDDPSIVVPPEATSRRGPRPQVLQARSLAEEVAATCDQLEKWNADGVRYDDMLVVYGSAQHQRALWAECKRRELPYFCVSLSSKTKGQVMEVAGQIRSSTVHSIKGLEFGHVAICGVNQIAVIDDADDEVARRRLLYVGMTRATDRLFLTVSGEGSLGADLLSAASA